MSLRIHELYSKHAFYRPGEALTFRAEIESSAARQMRATLNLVTPDGVSVTQTDPIGLAKGMNATDLLIKAPTRAKRGYLVELLLQDQARAVTAVDVLQSWTEDPRYGFMSEFGPDDPGIEHRVATMSRFHVNCLQFYDWMYRHYRLLPPQEQFTDALGRKLSLKTVRQGIEAGRRHHIAALAYAAVYAAEPEFFRQHERWGLYGSDGSSLMLGNLFHLMDLAPGSAWVRHLLADYERTLRSVPFDGFHLDQYGFPRVAYAGDGQLRDVASDLANFVDAADSASRRARPGAGNIFNAVNAWPVEEVARRKQVATYIEVWPPHTTYADLVALVRRCRDLAPKKPVILAAYASFLARKPSERTAAAGLAMLSAVIFAAGAWHLLLGEGDRALTEAYYPKHVRLQPQALRTLRRYYDLAVGYREFLRDPALRDVAATFIDGAEPTFGCSLPYSSAPAAGRIWAGIRSKPGWLVISLVNLLDETDLAWDRSREAPEVRVVRLRLPNEARIRRCLVATPDGEGSLAPLACDISKEDGRTIEVSLSTWSLVIVETDR